MLLGPLASEPNVDGLTGCLVGTAFAEQHARTLCLYSTAKVQIGALVAFAAHGGSPDAIRGGCALSRGVMSLARCKRGLR